jgi:predicted component of type VI protein secretion system
MPTGKLLRPVTHFVRTYAGAEMAFDVEPVLAPNEAPPCVLYGDSPDPPRLGWNTWLRRDPVPRQFDGVSFSLEGSGTWVVEPPGPRSDAAR